MNSSTSLARKNWICLLFILPLTLASEGQPGMTPAGSLCISHCETCPVMCSPSPPSTPKSPPSPTGHHSPPPQEQTGSRPPPHPKPSSPSPPVIYGYNPGLLQQNFSYPYYYFYTSKAAGPLPLHLGFIPFVFFIFFHVIMSTGN